MAEPPQVQINPLVALDETIRRTEAADTFSRNRILVLSQQVFDLTAEVERLKGELAAAQTADNAPTVDKEAANG
jgi:hypothetical protein